MTDQYQRQMLLAAIGKLSVGFNRDLANAQVDTYIENLEDLPAEALLHATNKIMRTSHFFPSIAEIREAALIGDNEETAGEAWYAVCGRIQRFGRNGGTQEFTELTRAAIRACGGYDTLCRSERPDNDRYVFQRAYEELAKRNQRETLLTRQDEEPEMPAAITAGIKQIGHREELAPVEDRAKQSLAKLREMRQQIGRGDV